MKMNEVNLIKEKVDRQTIDNEERNRVLQNKTSIFEDLFERTKVLTEEHDNPHSRRFLMCVSEKYLDLHNIFSKSVCLEGLNMERCVDLIKEYSKTEGFDEETVEKGNDVLYEAFDVMLSSLKNINSSIDHMLHYIEASITCFNEIIPQIPTNSNSLITILEDHELKMLEDGENK